MYASILVAFSLALSPAPGFCRAAPALTPEAGVTPPPSDPSTSSSTSSSAPAAALAGRLELVAAIAVDTSTAGEEGQVLGQRLVAKAEAEMQAIHVAKGEGETLPRLVIVVSALSGDSLGWSYTIDINHADKTPIPGGSFRGQCVDCTENELVDRVGNDTRSLLPQLHAYIANFNAQIDGEQRRREEDERRKKEEEQRRRDALGVRGSVSEDSDAPPMDLLCKAGIGLAAGGVVTAGVGVGLVLKPDSQPDPTIGYETRSTHLPGYVTLGVGGVVLLTGVALLVVGSRRARGPQTTFAPTIQRDVIGLTWTGRF